MAETLEYEDLQVEEQPMQIVKLNVTDSRIAELKKAYAKLSIDGIEDRAGLKKVYEARQEVKRERIAVEKNCKELKARALDWQRRVNQEEKRVVGELEAIEAHLQSEEDRIADEKVRIATEAQRREEQRIQERINKLAAFGFGVDYATVKSIDDATFETVLNNAKTEHEKELVAKAEAEKAAQVERDRLEDERKELELLRQQQAEAQRIIDENNARIAKEQAEKEAAIKAEQDRQEAERKAIQEAKDKQERERIRQEELEAARTKAAEEARLQAIEDARIAAELKAQQDADEKSEHERQAALRPDKQKLEEFAQSLSSMKLPDVTDKKAKVIVASARVMIEKMESYILNKINEL